MRQYLYCILILLPAPAALAQMANPALAQAQIRRLLTEKIRIRDFDAARAWLQQHAGSTLALPFTLPSAAKVTGRSNEVIVHDDEKQSQRSMLP